MPPSIVIVHFSHFHTLHDLSYSIFLTSLSSFSRSNVFSVLSSSRCGSGFGKMGAAAAAAPQKHFRYARRAQRLRKTLGGTNWKTTRKKQDLCASEKITWVFAQLNLLANFHQNWYDDCSTFSSSQVQRCTLWTRYLAFFCPLKTNLLLLYLPGFPFILLPLRIAKRSLTASALIIRNEVRLPFWPILASPKFWRMNDEVPLFC